jgi:TolB-like protein
MASLIPGYEYDIFISYRHKDNRYDGWVTEFVDNLKKELEATIKEDVSVYFDANPHNGLLETHHVDKSLEGKLKAVIFVPIISQTYCDANSFAWKNELIPFKTFAENDSLGLQVRLRSGNFANRILPVRIHELDMDDKKLLEGVIGPIRSIDFIFRTAGVNRPLRSREEHDEENLNKTLYRDQINKVANAIKDIIYSTTKVSYQQPLPGSKVQPATMRVSRKLIATAGVLIATLISGYIFFSTDINSGSPGQMTLAVLPFSYLGGQDSAYLSRGLADDITSRLSKIRSLLVLSESVRDVIVAGRSPGEIGHALNADFVLDGSIRRKAAGGWRVVVRLVDVSKGVQVWSEALEKEANDVLTLQMEIADKIARYLQLSLSADEQGKLASLPTTSIEAYDLYLRSKELRDKGLIAQNMEAIKNYRRAITIDPKFMEAHLGLAESYFANGALHGLSSAWLDSALIQVTRAIELNPSHTGAMLLLGNIHQQKGNLLLAKKWFIRTNELMPGKASSTLARLMRRNFKFDSSLYYSSEGLRFEQSMFRLISQAEGYFGLAMYDSALTYFERAHFMNPEHPLPRRYIAHVLASTGEYDRAIGILQSVLLSGDDSTGIRRQICSNYIFKKDWDELERFVRANGMEEDYPMAYLLMQRGEVARATALVAKLKQTQQYTLALAILAVIEKDFASATNILKTGYSELRVSYTDIVRLPYFLDLRGTREFDELVSAMENDISKARENLKRMALN